MTFVPKYDPSNNYKFLLQLPPIKGIIING
ncbi:hypothetical protein pKMKP103_CDS0035 [Klebsiella phage pKMKP103]|uniref:Uncharacterized protein n=1 Tax=Klebsiella phage vB_KpnS_Uniso31 TaxID=2951200 RepID=A0A9E7NGM4_9CAUD|nr:hypothetical protein [Klebsiella phage vB_KpnS_Uniso31]WOZ53484.1 hypothetical protein pKMKP103_CDS0035 [Klebsiella phage pKMKP103]